MRKTTQVIERSTLNWVRCVFRIAAVCVRETVRLFSRHLASITRDVKKINQELFVDLKHVFVLRKKFGDSSSMYGLIFCVVFLCFAIFSVYFSANGSMPVVMMNFWMRNVQWLLPKSEFSWNHETNVLATQEDFQYCQGTSVSDRYRFYSKHSQNFR